jgi:hypothetical protein
MSTLYDILITIWAIARILMILTSFTLSTAMFAVGLVLAAIWALRAAWRATAGRLMAARARSDLEARLRAAEAILAAQSAQGGAA